MSGGIYTTDKSKTIISLDDVDINNISNGQALIYDSSSETFSNQSVPILSSISTINNELLKKDTSTDTIVGADILSVATSVGPITTQKTTFVNSQPPIALSLSSIESRFDNGFYYMVLNPHEGNSSQKGVTLKAFNDNTRVGINVANPTEDLEIDGNIQLDSNNQSRIIFYDKQDDHEHAEIDAEGSPEGDGGQLIFYTKEDGGLVTERMRITDDGSVGIGTNNPTTTLDVNGDFKVNGDITGDNLFLGENGQTPKIDMFFRDKSVATGNNSYGAEWDTKIEIGKSDEFTLSPAFPPNEAYGMNVQVESDGIFVGVETYDSGSNWRPLLKWGDDSTDTPFRIVSHNPSNTFEFGTDGNYKISGNDFRVNDILHRRTNTSTYQILPNLGWSGSFNSKGEFSLSQYNAMLRVLDSGNGEITKLQCYKDGNIYYRGTFVDTSDERLKSYETDVSNATEMIMKMKPKFYKKHPTLITDDPTPDLSGVLHYDEYGFIAQELNEDPQLSHFVKENPEDNIYHVNYIQMIPLLVQTIKELNERIKVLESSL